MKTIWVHLFWHDNDMLHKSVEYVHLLLALSLYFCLLFKSVNIAGYNGAFCWEACKECQVTKNDIHLTVSDLY